MKNFIDYKKTFIKYKQPIDILQNNIIGWQIECKISGKKRKEEEKRQQQVDNKNKNTWIPPLKLRDGLFDNVNMDGIVYYNITHVVWKRGSMDLARPKNKVSVVT